MRRRRPLHRRRQHLPSIRRIPAPVTSPIVVDMDMDMDMDIDMDNIHPALLAVTDKTLLMDVTIYR